MDDERNIDRQVRSNSVFSSAVDSQIDWNELFARMDKHQGSVDDFKKLMYKVQSKRREFVCAFLRDYEATNDVNMENVDKTLISSLIECLQLFRKVYLILSNSENYQKDVISNSEKMRINIKDEIIGLQKDLVLLDRLHSIHNTTNNYVKKLFEIIDFSGVLAPYHPTSSQVFFEEQAKCVNFLKRFVDNSESGRKPIMITDWDGTMKDYCSQYVTNLQPIYSALSMAIFSNKCTRVTAVLTAGPLRGPGILDLTALPKDGPVVFGGSWGREWWLDGKRVVHEEGISDAGMDALERLSDEMSRLLQKQEFSHFGLIGSGVQRKVDRLTLGVQTVCKHVSPDLSMKYQEEVKERLHRVDPNEEILHFDPSTELEVEVVVHSDGIIWNKANGIDHLIQTISDTIEKDKVLICGDTHSDLPMVVHALEKNKKGAMFIFVTMKESLKEKVVEIVGDSNNCCFVSSPDVIHAAMMTLLTTT
uniref:Trehalose-6-phosphate phosphatase helical bundle domain-containing protein n=1 Tax=Meloidogyne incognita TaxID=6306 RepID=A0A914LXU2_MELIC